jgi:hypothetical protein
MNQFSLYKRMQEHGTLAEKPNEVPDARFALPSTIHWMRALAILVEALKLAFRAASKFYAKVQRRPLSDKETNSVCEQLLFALHQFASLEAMTNVKNKADVARIGVVAWYYGIYGAGSAMIAAGDGSFPDNHAATAQQWDRQFAANGLAISPFADRLSNLVPKSVEDELAPIRLRGTHSLTVVPTTSHQAWGCCAEYISGTAEWEQWNVRERLLEHRDFKVLKVDNFRTTAARTMRDGWYAKRGIAFLHQAARYRGKANYRDAIYLAYGKSVPTLVDGFIDDLSQVLRGFMAMAAGYASIRMGRDLWSAFLDDLESKRSNSVSPKNIWS